MNFKNLVSPALMMAILLVASGCESPEAREFSAGPAGQGHFRVTTELCRKASKKSGRRIGVGNDFQMATKSSVHGFLDVEGAEPGRTYTWHLVWIKPDGKELFRKYADVTVAEATEGFETTIQWKKAENLHYLKEKVIASADGSYSLPLKLNTSIAKERMPGTYKFRIYLDRRYLMEEEFTVSGI